MQRFPHNFIYTSLLVLLSLLPLLNSLKLNPHTSNSWVVDKFKRNIPGAISATFASVFLVSSAAKAEEKKLEYMPALKGLDYGKPRTYYPDFVQEKSGLQYKIIKEGSGKSPQRGDRAVVDWEGYTIGYYGRPFQTRNKVKGGAFDTSETDYFRWVLGSGNAIAALEEAVQHLKVDGVMQIIVPPELGYPSNDPDHVVVGPKPSNFSGQRALNFVLDNQNLLDKTLLINIRLVKVDAGYAERKGISLQ